VKGTTGAFTYADANPFTFFDPNGEAPKPVGWVYVVAGKVSGRQLYYTGQAVDLAERTFSPEHPYARLIGQKGTRVYVRRVYADLDVPGSGQGSIESARHEALAAAEQATKDLIGTAARNARGKAVALNKIEAATPENELSFRDEHAVREGRWLEAEQTEAGEIKLKNVPKAGARGMAAKGLGTAMGVVNLWDVYRTARELNSCKLGVTNLQLTDDHGTFEMWWHWKWKSPLSLKYSKRYVDGDKKGQEVSLDEEEAESLLQLKERLFGRQNWIGDLEPGELTNMIDERELAPYCEPAPGCLGENCEG
jgi:hypothetical protein